MKTFLLCKSQLNGPFSTKYKPICTDTPYGHLGGKKTKREKKKHLTLLGVYLQRHCPKPFLLLKIAEVSVLEVAFMLYFKISFILTFSAGKLRTLCILGRET